MTLTKVRYVSVDEDDANSRLDNFLGRHYKGVPKSRVYRMIRSGEVRVNKKRVKAHYRIQPGDQVRLPPAQLADPKESLPSSAAMCAALKEQILYEDANLLIINKPAGMAVHGGSGVALGVIEVLRQCRPEQKALELVHRLDRDTSGCLMIAKKRSMLRQLHQLLRENAIDKTYLACVHGHWPLALTTVDYSLRKFVQRSGERIVVVDAAGKPSLTEFAIEQHGKELTLLTVRLHTGRTHQIRVHTAAAGYPVVGDVKYGDADRDKLIRQQGFKRLMLHAASLSIPLPDRRQPLGIKAPLDDEMRRFVGKIGRI